MLFVLGMMLASCRYFGTFLLLCNCDLSLEETKQGRETKQSFTSMYKVGSLEVVGGTCYVKPNVALYLM
jgi:hypothetical protein